MSCCFGSEKTEELELELKQRNEVIEKAIRNEKKKPKPVRVVLLGAVESGKSTFLKQIKIIHDKPLFDNYSAEKMKSNIYQNIIKGMKVLIDAKTKLKIEWGCIDNEKHARHVFSYNNETIDTKQFQEYSESVIELWKDSGIQLAFNRRIEFHISDGLRYLLDDLQRIANEDYLPSNQDILYSRKGTKSVTEFAININSVPFHFIDVGGQRSQRKFWFFEDVTAVLFFVSTNEYDQVILEDQQTNRLRESLLIFKTIINNKAFSKVSFILFLNKTDLLNEKLKQTEQQLTEFSSDIIKSQTNERLDKKLPKTIRDYFPEFGPELNPLDIKSVQNFIFELFNNCRLDRNKTLLHHFTTATNTENIKNVFKSVKSIILEQNLQTILIQ